ncbi:hypothetical protein [Bradyrhizobium sp. F1.13.3]|uniref:hypothetical protein n=1 Tax=Bradyrhizobium sp. F1.13.3 TaxID=3156351 RepID=UPI003392548C
MENEKTRLLAEPPTFRRLAASINRTGAGATRSRSPGAAAHRPYHEFRHLQIKGRLLTPAGLKADTAEISLLPSSDLVEERRKDLTPVALGSLTVGPDGIPGNIGIPWGALTPILQMLIAGRFKFILMRGTRFRHRTSKLKSLRIETKLTEDGMSVG